MDAVSAGADTQIDSREYSMDPEGIAGECAERADGAGQAGDSADRGVNKRGGVEEQQGQSGAAGGESGVGAELGVADGGENRPKWKRQKKRMSKYERQMARLATAKEAGGGEEEASTP
jgi:hypothetical protein